MTRPQLAYGTDNSQAPLVHKTSCKSLHFRLESVMDPLQEQLLHPLYTGWNSAEPCPPDAPVGAGGCGTFNLPGSLGLAPQDAHPTVHHPGSSAAKALTPSDLSTADPQVVRLREIRQLVKSNNRSSLDENLVICQIFMESRFDAHAGAGHSAKGLMQIQKNAVRQVYKYRKQKELGHMPSDKVTAEVFKEADILYSSKSIFDQATNIQLGTEYMQYWLDTTKTIADAYKKYRGKTDGIYYTKIKTAAEKLKKSPESMQALNDMFK